MMSYKVQLTPAPVSLPLNGTLSVGGALAGKVKRLEQELQELPQTIVNPAEHVHGGVYARTGMIPAGTTFIGAVHRKNHINIVCGDVSIATDGGTLRLVGYHVLPANAGSKRIAYAHADTMWTTLAQTGLTNFREIEDELVEDSSQLQTRQHQKD